MLLRLEPFGMRRGFAEMEKLADLEAEIGQDSIIRIRQFLSRGRREIRVFRWTSTTGHIKYRSTI